MYWDARSAKHQKKIKKTLSVMQPDERRGRYNVEIRYTYLLP